MLQSDRDIMKQRLAALGAERGDALVRMQKLLDERFGVGRVRARKLERNGILRLVTPSAPLASDIRLGWLELTSYLNAGTTELKKIVISIGS